MHLDLAIIRPFPHALLLTCTHNEEYLDVLPSSDASVPRVCFTIGKFLLEAADQQNHTPQQAHRSMPHFLDIS